MPARSIHSAARELREGRFSSAELVEECLGRIDEREPEVRAWVSVDREGARARARELDAERSAGRSRGLLRGIPIGIKDIIDVAGWPTAGGYPAWSSRTAPSDARIVRRLRDHGAVLLGKTVTTMFAGFDPPVTRNPLDPTRTPGGSSSGSAAATAAGMCLGAIGTQTGGSITRPASFCGLAACKPTFGRVSLEGILPLSATMDHPGPMATSVRDIALLLEALVTEAGSEPVSPSDAFAAAIDSDRGLPLRLGRLGGFYATEADAEMTAALDAAVRRFAAAGAVVVDIAPPPSFATVLADHKKLISGGAARVHAELFAAAPDTFLPRIRELIEEGLTVTDAKMARSIERQDLARREMLSAMDGLDALLCPATRGAAPDTSTTGDPSFNAPWSFTGLPVVSFPIGAAGRLPLCVQMVGRPWEEAALLRAAAWCEWEVAAHTP